MLGRPELKIIDTDLEREIERAWRQHEPERDRIPSTAWRKLQALKNQYEPTALKLRAALNDEAALHALVKQCCCRRGIARQDFLKSVRRDFPGAEIKIAHRDVCEFSWLAPSPPVIADPKDHGERQACTLVCYLCAWPTPPFGIKVCSAWSIEVPDHAAGRYLQRAGDAADFKSALFEAANHFHAADMAKVTPHLGRGTDIYLPAGRGYFLCTVVGAKSGGISFLYARAATWIEKKMLRPDQVPLPKAETADSSVAALLLDP